MRDDTQSATPDVPAMPGKVLGTTIKQPQRFAPSPQRCAASPCGGTPSNKWLRSSARPQMAYELERMMKQNSDKEKET
jgi:hypothetical protein